MAINGPASPYRARNAFLGHIARSRDHGVSHGALPTRNPPKAIVASYGLSPTQVKGRGSSSSACGSEPNGAQFANRGARSPLLTPYARIERGCPTSAGASGLLTRAH